MEDMKISRRDLLKYTTITLGGLALTGTDIAFSQEKITNNTKKKVQQFINTSGKEAYIAGYPLSWWIKKFQLPLHINYAPLIRQNIRDFKKVFQEYYPNGHIRFAGKSNPHPAIFQVVKQEGAGVDVASYNEAKCALLAGVSPEHLDLNGNCKEDFLLNDAIKKNMLIVLDSVEELQLVSQLALKAGKKPRVILRLSGYELGNVTSEDIFTAGVWSKFGVSVKLVPDIIKSLKNYPHIDFLGFHTHIGSQITEVEPYLAVLGKMVELGHMLKANDRKCKIINIGGGFPVSYVDKASWTTVKERIKQGYISAQKSDMSKLYVWDNKIGSFSMGANSVVDFSKWTGEKFYTPYDKSNMLKAILKGDIKVHNKTINTVKALKELQEPTLVIEPGRSLAGDTGITLAKVSHVRSIAFGHNLLTLEMGVTSYAEALIHPVINRWALISDYHKKDPKPFEAFIAGNLCFSGDMLSRYKVAFQRKPKRADVVITYDTGAYGGHFFAANSNAFPRPARVIADDNGNISILRKRDSYNEIFSL